MFLCVYDASMIFGKQSMFSQVSWSSHADPPDPHTLILQILTRLNMLAQQQHITHPSLGQRWWTVVDTSKENWQYSVSRYFRMRLLCFGCVDNNTHTRTHTHTNVDRKVFFTEENAHPLTELKTLRRIEITVKTCVYFVSLRFCILSQKTKPYQSYFRFYILYINILERCL